MKKEDKEFLVELQNELKTQTTDGNAKPTFWGIIEEHLQIVPSGYGDIEMIVEDFERYTIEDYVKLIDDTIDNLDDENEKKEMKEKWDEVDKTYSYDIVDFNNEELGGNAEVFEFVREDKLSTYTGAFLTKKACQKYIDNYGYNHKKPRTFAMTAIRNFEFSRLINILTNMNLDDIKED